MEKGVYARGDEAGSDKKSLSEKEIIVAIILSDLDDFKRFEVMERFAALADSKDDVRTLLWVLANDRDPMVRHEAAAQLLKLGEGRADLVSPMKSRIVEALTKAILQDPYMMARHESLEALAYIADEKSSAFLNETLRSQNIDVRASARFATGLLNYRISNRLAGDEVYHKIIDEWRETAFAKQKESKPKPSSKPGT